MVYGLRWLWPGGAVPLGPRGERVAVRFLKRSGYRILGRNLRSRLGEIDVLAESPDRRVVVVVEVKAGGGGKVAPEVRVNRTKQRKLATLAAQIARRHHLQSRAFRFDVIGVDLPEGQKPEIRHHVGAFESHF